jgi:hypothetical protein
VLVRKVPLHGSEANAKALRARTVCQVA